MLGSERRAKTLQLPPLLDKSNKTACKVGMGSNVLILGQDDPSLCTGLNIPFQSPGNKWAMMTEEGTALLFVSRICKLTLINRVGVRNKNGVSLPFEDRLLKADQNRFFFNLHNFQWVIYL